MRTSGHRLLRIALRTDAIACALLSVGAILILLDTGSWLAQLNVSPNLLIAVGSIAFLSAPLLWSLSRRSENMKARGRRKVWLVVATNLAWAIFCIVGLSTGWTQPSQAGSIVIISQAVITAAIAYLEWLGLRRAGAGFSADRRVQTTN